MNSTRLLILNPGDRAPILQDVANGCFCELATTYGIGRVGVVAAIGRSEITVGFVGAERREWIQRPAAAELSIEALTTLHLEIKPISNNSTGQELIGQWLWDLHFVRHPVGAMARLKAFMQLMLVRFGHRTIDGYVLPFQLSHSRLAEVIGVTRSTATRLLSLMRQQGQISINTADSSLLVSPLVMDSPQPWWVETTSKVKVTSSERC